MMKRFTTQILTKPGGLPPRGLASARAQTLLLMCP